MGLFDNNLNVVVEYSYDSWGNVLSITGSLANTLGQDNPFRYRGYYFDSDTGLYYLNSRYYDANIGRFVNADGELSGEPSIRGYNLFTYGFNNPVNMSDENGNWPKWLSGALNVVSGVSQMAAGAALGAIASWTGVGAVVAGFLILNGSATTAQGVGQIINHVTKSNAMREDNIVRTSVQKVGRALGGDTGAKVAGCAYDVAVVAANLYAGKVNLEKSMPKIINSKLFEINNGYGIKIGQTAKASYGYINLLYQNPSFTEQYGIRGGTFVSINNSNGDCIFRIDWDPKDGLHIQ